MTGRSSSTSSSTTTQWCGRWSRPARATTISSSRGTWRRTGTVQNDRAHREQEPNMTTHTLSVLFENKPGVRVRIAGLFARRGFNIDALAVGPTEHAEISRMTIVVNCAENPLEQVTKQLNKLVNVLKIVELILIKVRADAEARTHVLQTIKDCRAKVVDVGPDAVTVEATGNRDKLDALVRVLEPFGIKELVQSGIVGIGRGSRSITDRSLRPVGDGRAIERTA